MKCKVLLRFIAILSVLFIPLFGNAQVINDLIADRISLEINHPFQSTTVNCKVEKTCVNERQTGKCIKYHNDQWFTIVPETAQPYYINISAQSCRDLKGVQLVVIDGIPCDTASYQIVSCISLATQDDVFLPLADLTVGREYLLNIDGYLHDFCDFTIEFGTESKGLPMINDHQNILTYAQKNQYLNLNWEIEESMETAVIEYLIYRR